MTGEYEGVRRVVYDGGATFVPVCHCGRFVKPDETITTKGEQVQERAPNATCKRHGRVAMLFEGYY